MKQWTHSELSDLWRLRETDGKTLKECAELYNVSVSAMTRRMDRNPVDPEYRLSRHKALHSEFTKNGYCSSCTCLYTEDDLR